MFAGLTTPTRRSALAALAVAAVSGLILLAAGRGPALRSAEAQDPVRPVPTAPVAEQPSAKLIVDPPKPEPLARGVAFIQFRTEDLQVVPVFGAAAATVSPRIGHLHVTVDDSPWHWAHTSDGPIIVADLPPGPHKVLIELADADHKALAKDVVKFEVPRR
jgi:hypothetical protein